jgi:FHA domain-containing protein/type VI secretion system protein
LVLRALTYNDLPPVAPIVGTIHGDGGTVGRGSDNTVVLPDPMKVVSRVHLRFLPREEGLYRVLNVSSGNPAYVNGIELGPGAECPVVNDDEIIVGGYVLKADYSSSDAAPQALPSRQAAAPAEVTRGTNGIDDDLTVMLRDAAEAMLGEGLGRDGEGSLDPLALFEGDAESVLSEILRLDEAPPATSAAVHAAATVEDAPPRTNPEVVERIYQALRKNMLNRFDPEVVAANDPAGGFLDRALPFLRKARLWDAYVLHYRRIRSSLGEGKAS